MVSADLNNSACGRSKNQLKRVNPSAAVWVFFCLN